MTRFAKSFQRHSHVRCCVVVLWRLQRIGWLWMIDRGKNVAMIRVPYVDLNADWLAYLTVYVADTSSSARPMPDWVTRVECTAAFHGIESWTETTHPNFQLKWQSEIFLAYKYAEWSLGGSLWHALRPLRPRTLNAGWDLGKFCWQSHPTFWWSASERNQQTHTKTKKPQSAKRQSYWVLRPLDRVFTTLLSSPHLCFRQRKNKSFLIDS